MVAIHSDSFEISKELKALVRLCESSGARFHPDLAIQYQEGGLSVTCKTSGDERLASLSKESLIPVESRHFSLEKERFILNQNADTGWSALQEDIAHVMFSIFNLSEKIRQIRQRSYWLSMVGKTELCTHLSSAKGFDLSDKRFLDCSKSKPEQ